MTESQVQYRTWMCLICGYVYDEAAGAPEEVETVFHLLERLAANPSRGVRRSPGLGPFEAIYTAG